MTRLSGASITKIVKHAYEAADSRFSLRLNEACFDSEVVKNPIKAYRDEFMDILIKDLYRIKKIKEEDKDVNFKYLLECLRGSGVKECSVTTPPLCLNVMYQDLKIGFMYSYAGTFFIIEDSQYKVKGWNAGLIDILETIYNECNNDNISQRVNELTLKHKKIEQIDKIITTTSNKMILETFKDISSYISHNCVVSVNTVYVNIQFKDLEKLRFSCKFEELENYLQLIKMKITEYFNGQ